MTGKDRQKESSEERQSETQIETHTQRTDTGACLRPHWRQWRQVSSEQGKWVKTGVRLPWRCRPKPFENKQKELNEQEAEWLDKEVARMLKANAIYVNKADVKTLGISSIYTVAKKDSEERRPVFNLRKLNTFLQTKHFKMTTLKDVKAMVNKGCWKVKIDFKDCFWQVPVAQEDQRFLSFRWRGKVYSFRCLPFGLSVSPWFITKLFRPVIAHLQQKGIKAVIYIDDMLVFGDTREQCQKAAEEALALFKQLGVVVNVKKSCLSPSQQVDYLGYTINSVDMTIRAPTKKLINVRKELKKFFNRPRSSARQAASVLGKLNALADALFPVRVHTAALHQFKLDCLRKADWDRLLTPSKEALKETRW